MLDQEAHLALQVPQAPLLHLGRPSQDLQGEMDSRCVGVLKR